MRNVLVLIALSLALSGPAAGQISGKNAGRLQGVSICTTAPSAAEVLTASDSTNACWAAAAASQPTRVVKVDPDGSGDYTTIKAAADYVATIAFGAGTRDADSRWVIVVRPGKYTESAFTIVGYTTLFCDPSYASSFGGLDSKPARIYNAAGVTSGPFISIQGGEIVGCEVVLDGTPTGALTAIESNSGFGFWANIHNVTVQLLADATTHEVRGIGLSGSAVLRLDTVHVLHEGIVSQANGISFYTTGTGGATIANSFFSDVAQTPLAAIEHNSSGTITLRSLAIGQSGGSTYVNDIDNAGAGTVRVQGQGNYFDHTNVTGTITYAGDISAGGEINMVSGFFQSSTTAGITASTTQAQGQGQLTTQLNQVSTVANANDVVTMPAAVSGRSVTIVNDGANTLQIFPDTSDDMGNGVDTSTSLGASETEVFVSYDATNWRIEAGTQIFHAEFKDSNNTDAFAVTETGAVEMYHSNGLTAGDLAGWTFDIGGGGTSYPIASIADAGGGDILVTTTGSHTLEVGAMVSHAGLADAAYEGVFQVLTVPLATTYTVTATFTATGTGTMQEGATLTANPSAAGQYWVVVSISGTSQTNNETFDFAFYNKAAAVGVPQRRKFGTGGDFGGWPLSGGISIASGDKLSLAITNTDSGGDVTIRNISFALFRL